MRLGPAKTIIGQSNLFHIVKLEKYRENIFEIKRTLKYFENLTTKDLIYNSDNIINIKLKNLENNLETLVPKFRTRRGLINGLGTIIKSITGNMDANDALVLNQQIEKILNNENSINKDMDNQHKINHEMIERFGNITKHVNDQQQTIINYLKHFQEQMGNKIRLEEHTIEHMQLLNQIDFNINLLNDHISSISEAVVLAKLNIISKHILSRDELRYIHSQFEKQNITLYSDEHIYEMLNLQAYYNGSNIIFNIQIPTFSKDQYTMYHIIPLPTRDNKVILSKPFLILNPKTIQYFDERCPQIEGTYYCQETSRKENTNGSSCIGNILNNKPAYCELHPREIITEILQPEPNYILLTNVPEILLTSTCGLEKQKIQGTSLIHYSLCEVTINDIVYTGTNNIYWDEINIIPTIYKEIKLTNNKNNITLKTLNNYQFAERDFRHHLEPFAHRTQLYKTTGILTIPFMFIILICVFTYLKFSRILRTYIVNRTETSRQTVPANETATFQFPWPSLISRGEELRM